MIAMRDTGNKKNLFIIGCDTYNAELLNNIPDLTDWHITKIFSHRDIQPPEGRVDFNALYETAKKEIRNITDHPDVIIGHMDFPVSCLVSLLQRDFDLPGPSPKAVAMLEHKYWMRLEQQKIFPQETPTFSAINPFNVEGALQDCPAYPFWLKPVKAHSSVLGFLIEDDDDLKSALHDCRQKIHLIGKPFNDFLDHIEGRDVLNGIDGNFAVAESLINAPEQFTLEGYVYQGKTEIYGAVKSVRAGRHQSSFSSFRYPADVPDEVVVKAKEKIAKLLSHIGFDNSPFNVEFFWDPETNRLSLLEVNPRISKSHAPLFKMVDGLSHHKVAIDLCLGKKPDMPSRQGPDHVAAKYILRSFEQDGIVRHLPSNKEIEELERILPDIDISILVEKNMRLSSMAYQESYSYELVNLYLGGQDLEMLEDAYKRAIDGLPVLINPIPKAA